MLIKKGIKLTLKENKIVDNSEIRSFFIHSIVAAKR